MDLPVGRCAASLGLLESFTMIHFDLLGIKRGWTRDLWTSLIITTYAPIRFKFQLVMNRNDFPRLT